MLPCGSKNFHFGLTIVLKFPTHFYKGHVAGEHVPYFLFGSQFFLFNQNQKIEMQKLSFAMKIKLRPK